MAKWLPDAELDPHPRVTWFAGCCVHLAVSACYRIDTQHPTDSSLTPGTLVISNHQRDADVPILGSVLCWQAGLHLRWPMLFFACREDMFHRGFLSTYLDMLPNVLRGALDKTSMAWFFRIMRAEPLRRVREFTLAEALAELPAAADLLWCLNDRGRRELASRASDSPSHPILAAERCLWGWRRLSREARQKLAPAFRARIAIQLDRFAELLDTGRMVYFAPEGTTSLDGRFGRVRAGAWRLARLTAAPPPILPLALSYDPLRAGRLRSIVRLGTAVTAYSTDNRAQFDRMLERQIRRLYTINASHLASRFLVSGPTLFTTADFARWVEHAREQLTMAGILLDPEIVDREAGSLAADRLDWLRRTALVARGPAGWRTLWPRNTQPGWRHPANIVAYCDNALDDHLRALAPGLSLGP